ncbi:MAG: 50S ribosomal protein L32 [Proteobacteria bacterium]|nr:50S ribosomal protein L32 [Pseudomonadota bacterium]
MPVPKKRTTKARRGDRRSHDRLHPTYAIVCPNCGEAVLRHRVCTKCGQYRGKQLMQIGEAQES